MSTVRGCPPRGLCLAGGISGSTMAHCSSVRSEEYFFRDWSFFHIRAHSSADGICANYLTNILFCQALFPDSLLVLLCVSAIRRCTADGTSSAPSTSSRQRRSRAGCPHTRTLARGDASQHQSILHESLPLRQGAASVNASA